MAKQQTNPDRFTCPRCGHMMHKFYLDGLWRWTCINPSPSDPFCKDFHADAEIHDIVESEKN